MPARLASWLLLFTLGAGSVCLSCTGSSTELDHDYSPAEAAEDGAGEATHNPEEIAHGAELPATWYPDVEAGQDYPNAGELRPGALREHAVTTVTPEYPTAAYQRGVGGLAVAYVLIDVEGRVARAHIVDAPDDAIGSAVLDAVRQWVWEPFRFDDTGAVFAAEGKILFYFEPTDGGQVLSPEERAAARARR